MWSNPLSHVVKKANKSSYNTPVRTSAKAAVTRVWKSGQTDEKEVNVNSDSDGKDDLVTQHPRDFIAPTAKKYS